MHYFDRVIDELEKLSRAPHRYLHPVIPEELETYVAGLLRGVVLSSPGLVLHDLVDAHQSAARSRGIKRASVPIYIELRDRGISDAEVIQEMVAFTIETLRALQQMRPEDRGEWFQIPPMNE